MEETIMNPGEWLPVIGLGMLAITTFGSIVGAYLVGRSRRRDASSLPVERGLDDRIERLGRLMETMAIEIERIGEGQRFVTKLMSDKGLPPAVDPVPPRVPGRVITPH